MNNDLYEVTRDEYVGFLGQIKPDARATETFELDDYKVIKTFSIKTNTHFCSRFIPKNDDEEEHYYVFNMPENEERCPPTPVQKFVLQTPEEVEIFFNLLGKAQRGELNDGVVH